jgi:hypothetical protein
VTDSLQHTVPAGFLLEQINYECDSILLDEFPVAVEVKGCNLLRVQLDVIVLICKRVSLTPTFPVNCWVGVGIKTTTTDSNETSVHLESFTEFYQLLIEFLFFLVEEGMTLCSKRTSSAFAIPS